MTVKIEIFDVEHGQCSLISSSSGSYFLVDAGHNSTTGWRPSNMLAARGIDELDKFAITNFDEDHASDFDSLSDSVRIHSISRNRTVSGDQVLQLKELGGVGRGIRALSAVMDNYVHPETRSVDFEGMKIRKFWNKYPGEFQDENNLSMLMILQWPSITIAFTGDLEKAGWKVLLQNPEVINALAEVDVFMASHHGRLNGYYEEVFTLSGMSPSVIVISDSGIDYESQLTGPRYRKHAVGVNHNGETRRVLTTRRDGAITFYVESDGAALDTERASGPLF